MCSTLNVFPIYREPPSYIREVLRSADNIYLFYDKVEKPTDVLKVVKSEYEESNASLDLTGNPLQVDLSSSISLLEEEYTWLCEENSHYPFSLNIVRKLINKFLREKLEIKKSVPSYIYGVCDGLDENCTLILGAYQSDNILCRTRIYNKGCFGQNNLRNSLDNMKQEHLDNMIASNCQVTTSVYATYIVCGNNLRNFKISGSVPYSSCIFYNISWNTYQYDIPEYVQSAEMTIQAVVGHSHSKMYNFWKDFLLLKIYIKILIAQPKDLEEFILSDSPQNDVDIFDEISTLVAVVQGVRKTTFKKKLNEQLDVNNLRQEDFADKLWNILICCNNVGDLKRCFHMLFEKLAMKESVKAIILDENSSSIASIINEIACGKLAVPTLSSTQALGCLIELGIRKLKNDYFYILNHHDCLNYESLEKYWTETIQEYVSETQRDSSNRITRNVSDKITNRRIRFTIHPTTSLMDTTERLRTLNCLLKMHVACEFLILREKKGWQEETFNALVESVKTYILKFDNAILAKSLSDYMLQEIKVNLHSNDVKHLQGKDPSVWNVRLTSSHDRSIVTTIFHHTMKPLFPLSIYNKYDTPSDDASLGEQVYYITKLVNFADKL